MQHSTCLTLIFNLVYLRPSVSIGRLVEKIFHLTRL